MKPDHSHPLFAFTLEAEPSILTGFVLQVLVFSFLLPIPNQLIGENKLKLKARCSAAELS